MNTNEMSSEFDVLYNQVNSNQAPGLDEYEKSIFLTRAQEEIIRMYFDPRGNKFQLGMDLSAGRLYDFSTLIKFTACESVVLSSKYDPRSLTYAWPTDCFLVLNESIVSANDGKDHTIYQIKPITFADYTNQMSKPYKYPPKSIVWRLITYQPADTRASDDDNSDDPGDDSTIPASNTNVIVELIGRVPQDIEYRIRYIKRPTPIILVDLSSQDLKINGEDQVTDCALPEGIHRDIVYRAVELATAVYNPQALGNIIGVGNISETNLGVVPQNNDKQ